MELPLNLYRRLNLLQRTLRFKIAATIVLLVAAGAYFGPLLGRTYDLQQQRLALGRALADQNRLEEDEHAVSLYETGQVTVNGRLYGGEQMRRRAPYLFDEAGNLVAPERVAEDLLADQIPSWAPRFLLDLPGTTWMLALVTAAWLALIVWMELTLPFVLTLLGTAIPVLLGYAGGSGYAQFRLAVAGMGLLTFTFVLLTRCTLLLFQSPHQVFAVAHTVVKEATRNRLSLIFVILLLVCLPLLPMTLDADAPLRFRIQTFIARSLGLTYVLAACMTLFLATATVAFEIRDRQIWQLVSKPVRQINYLVGKWIGVLSVNVIILVVAGVSIFTYVKYLSQLPVAPGIEGMLDRLAVNDEVLTARRGSTPELDYLSAQQLRAQVEHTIANDPNLSSNPDIQLAVKRKIARELQEEHLLAQCSVRPIERERPGGNQQTYTFRGLDRARTLDSTLTLKYRFHILRDDEHETFPVGFVFNGDPQTATTRQYIPTVTHVLPLGSDLIKPDGTLDVAIVNLFEPPPSLRGRGELNFEDGDFEVLYKVGSFEGNFLRAVVMTWVKLAFLSVLGIACATLLSFPVACLLSFTIFLAGTIGPFLALSLEEYYPPPTSQLDWTNIGMVIQWAFQSFIRAVAQGLVAALSSFGEYRPTQSLVEGRLIPWRSIGTGFFWMGTIWSGVCLVVGYFVMRNRQLAIYSGHG